MAEITEYTFTHKEVAELLVKQTGIRDGHWLLLLEMSMSGGNIGSTESANPAVIVQITGFGLKRVEAGESPDSLTVNANPPSRTGKSA